ncbi:MAG TPA: nuclear transport factor 2 family protein [Bdellovibrionales bacterium]|nr:nuclear transport factor 2 family protein [Bdellovibrionales bacterium]
MEVASNYMANRIQTAIENCNVDELMSCYTEDAEIKVVDRDHPPSRPLEIRGKDNLKAFFSDVCNREMTHNIDMEIVDADHLAYTESCQYKDGTRVLSANMCELKNGRIAKETIVQAWDA